MKTLKAVEIEYVGRLPFCLALNACDIGVATLENGRRVYCTWGRGRGHSLEKTTFDLVQLDGRLPEVVLPPTAQLDALLSILVK